MKEFIEKLIERFLGECVIYAENYEKALNIANELTEEYINTSTDTSTDSVDTSSGWISVKESLPSDEKEYLVTLRDGEVTSAKYDKEEKAWVDPVEEYCEYPVIAWQNTPAPYKEGK